MPFADEQRDRIREGSITLTFRRWKRPQARAGARHRFPPDGVLVIEDITLVEAAAITPEDARRAGFESVANLLDTVTLSGQPVTGQPPGPSTTLYRVAFHSEAQADPRRLLAESDALDASARADLEARLARMDARSPTG